MKCSTCWNVAADFYFNTCKVVDSNRPTRFTHCWHTFTIHIHSDIKAPVCVKLFDLEYIKNVLQQFHIKESYCVFTCSLSLVVCYTCVKFHQYWFIHLWEVALMTNMEIWMDRSRSTNRWRVIKHLTIQVLLY